MVEVVSGGASLANCPLCGATPKRNGRRGVGGVLCTGDNSTVGMIHRFQTYGADQAEADAAWNRTARVEATDATLRADGEVREALQECVEVLEYVEDDGSDFDLSVAAAIARGRAALAPAAGGE